MSYPTLTSNREIKMTELQSVRRMARDMNALIQALECGDRNEDGDQPEYILLKVQPHIARIFAEYQIETLELLELP